MEPTPIYCQNASDSWHDITDSGPVKPEWFFIGRIINYFAANRADDICSFSNGLYDHWLKLGTLLSFNKDQLWPAYLTFNALLLEDHFLNLRCSRQSRQPAKDYHTCEQQKPLHHQFDSPIVLT